MGCQHPLTNGSSDRELLLLGPGKKPLGPLERELQWLGLCRRRYPGAMSSKEGTYGGEMISDCGDCYPLDRGKESHIQDEGVGCGGPVWEPVVLAELKEDLDVGILVEPGALGKCQALEENSRGRQMRNQLACAWSC